MIVDCEEKVKVQDKFRVAAELNFSIFILFYFSNKSTGLAVKVGKARCGRERHYEQAGSVKEGAIWPFRR